MIGCQTETRNNDTAEEDIPITNSTFNTSPKQELPTVDTQHEQENETDSIGQDEISLPTHARKWFVTNIKQWITFQPAPLPTLKFDLSLLEKLTNTPLDDGMENDSWAFISKPSSTNIFRIEFM